MPLTFVSSTPSTGTTDFFINRSLEVTFNEELANAAISDNTILLYDLDANRSIPLNLTKKATDPNSVVISPVVALKENTNYRLVLVGKDQGLVDYLVATNSDELLITVVVLFSTGDSVYQIDTTIEKNADTLTLEGDLFLPSNVKALGYDFTIQKIRPQNHSAFLTGDISSIQFTFTKDLMTGQDYSSWAEVNVYPILQDTQYLVSGTQFNTDGSIGIPNYYVTGSTNVLSIVFDSALPKNVAVTVDLNDSVRSKDLDSYGGNLNYSITTDIFPKVYGPELVKQELYSINNQINNDYIASLMFKNTIFLWEKLGRGISLDSLSFAARKYILYSTVLDIIEDKDYKKFLLAGTRRQLGDLNVSIDNLIGRLALKIARLQKEKDIAFETLVKGWQFKVLPGILSTSTFFGSRLWYDVNTRYTDPIYKYYQPDLPASNLVLNRRAKTTNPVW